MDKGDLELDDLETVTNDSAKTGTNSVILWSITAARDINLIAWAKQSRGV
jgi:hypothetical protein